ncbi:hypothetical protein K505DRAFT_355619 [Melanomma pulvis-pyrius CBS 109.77]|uniref:Uncharacterized protein n=1 Tax=Melanomma pulvis-pyrius CBS 109.77 TaxID=1314802 RepID=A0A6A6XY40_9PLEO|nr:hypothetical protein K505DRAFT_355619 [Melanomma pulvis-pyrius CBS 109.77]
MHFTSPTVLALLASTAHAWRAGLWGTNGKNLQVHGTAWPVCNNINAIPLGQVTFDTVTDNYPDPSRICVYSAPGCSGTILYCGGKKLTGTTVTHAGTAVSYKIGT